MSQENPVPAIEILLKSVTTLLEEDMVEEALILMGEKYSSISTVLKNSIIMNKANLKALKNQINDSTISADDAKVARAKILKALININAGVPEEIRLQQMIGRLKSIYTSTENEHLEKIIGNANNLVKINWLEKGIQKSKSVCQVIRSDGAKGTGFVLKGGYLMTNFHVLSSKDKVASAKIVFDYEEDLLGNLRATSEFFLDETDWKFSKIQDMDYTYVKIKDNPANPLAKWGFLELETFADPQIGSPVTIIQHPLGQTKQIALTANMVINVDKRKIFYETDTEPGSSGSPVFNNDWKVIALHHAGKTEEEGGLVIDEKTKERRGANEGILIKYIAESIWPENLATK